MLRDSLRKTYKKVPLPEFTILFNPNADVWYVSVTGIHLNEGKTTTSNYIYSIKDEVSDMIDFVQLGIAPKLVESTTYKDIKSRDEIEQDLAEITKNVITVS